jgi:acetyl esterase/lipase
MLNKYFYKFLLISSIMISSKATLTGQAIIPLYEGKIPNAKETVDEEKSEINSDSVLIISKVSRPTLSVYLPKKQNPSGAAVIICPGGGYSIVAAGHEGAEVARRFNEMGIAAFVLKYRIPDDSTMFNKEIGPLQDAQEAIMLVRKNAKKWHINKNNIGIMGFSAGGHLASTAGTHFNTSRISNPGHVSLRPNFMILVYPVISFTDSIGHIGSRDQLMGKNPSPEKIKEYSNELQVTKQTPPTFLLHAKDDDGVNVKNSLAFANALKKNDVPVEIYLYEKGGHGFGMHNKTSDVDWMKILQGWMKKMKFI